MRKALRAHDEDETRSIDLLVNKLNQDFPGFDGPRMLGLQRQARRHLSMLADRQESPDLEPLFHRVKPAMRIS